MEPDVRLSAMKPSPDYDSQDFTHTCRDFRHYCVDCCEDCHERPENLRVIKIDGVRALVCCHLDEFLYPCEDEAEKLLRAIFGERHDKTTK